MKLRKNFEGAFLVAAVLAIAASYATAQVPTIVVGETQSVVAAADAGMATVVVSAKRLNRLEKIVRV